MRRIRLTTAAQAQLEHIFKTTTDRRLRDRCQAVLMASRGRRRRIIAQDVGVHRTTVRRWLTHYHAQGVPGLQIHWAPGQPGRIPETLAPTIQGWVQDGPQGCGLIGPTGPMKSWRLICIRPRGSRSGARRCGTFVTGMVSGHTGRPLTLCGATPRSSRGPGRRWRPEKKAQTGACVLLSQDEARFPLVPTLRTTLGVKGHRPLVGTWDHKDLV
jgi:hypothetical protein